MRSDNLKRHVKSSHLKNFCAAPPLHPSVEGNKLAGQKRSVPADIATLDGMKFGSGKFETVNNQSRNPKIQKLVNEIVTDDEQDVSSTPAVKSLHKLLSPDMVKTIKVLPKLTPQAIAELFPLKQKTLATPSPQVLTNVFTPSKPRTKGDIIGYSDESDDSDTDEDENSEDEESKPEDSDDDSEDSVTSNDEKEPKPILKLLPATVKGLRKRFKQLWREFTRYGKHEHRNEIVFILDELLRQEAISRETYTQVNNILAESLDEDDGDTKDLDVDTGDEEEDEVKKIINSTVDYIVVHDKKELMELLTELKEEATEDYIDTLLKLEVLVTTFLTDEFLEEKPILPMIDELIRELENSPVARSKHHRLKMLVNDVNRNRYRVQSIFTRLDDASDKDDALTILKELVKEELLSEEQYEKVAKLEDLADLPAIAQIINDTKVGQGLSFLPRKVSDLRKSLHSLLTEVAETGNSVMKNKLTAVLQELQRLKAISNEQYEVIKKYNEIM